MAKPYFLVAGVLCALAPALNSFFPVFYGEGPAWLNHLNPFFILFHLTGPGDGIQGPVVTIFLVFSGLAVVLLMVGPTVSVLAGISGMRAAAFFPLATLSLVLRASLVLGFAAWIREYIELALAWIDEYWIPGTLVMVTLVALYRWRRGAPSAVMED